MLSHLLKSEKLSLTDHQAINAKNYERFITNEMNFNVNKIYANMKSEEARTMCECASLELDE